MVLSLMLCCPAALAQIPAESVDFAGQLRLNMASETAKKNVVVKTFVDGDTVHFLDEEAEDGVLRARFLAVNTPEITGKVEEYGKRAASFTKEKLATAASIVIESDDGRWNLDSTGGRYLVWVWYQPQEGGDYRCLNLELLQAGLARANATGQNRYGTTCSSALNQAREQKLGLYSGQKDPDFYYGEAVEVTLRELRINPNAYDGMKVAFHGIAAMNHSQSIYVESFDSETGLYFGMPVYYGHGMSGAGLEILSVGNEVRIVGTLQYYEAGGTWQVSGLTYRMMKPDDPGNIQKLSGGHSAAFVPMKAEDFAKGLTALEVGGEVRSFARAELAMGTSVSMEGLTVQAAIADENGAVMLTCLQNDAEVSVRVEPFGGSGESVSPDCFTGAAIAVKGIVDCYEGAYLIRVLMPEHLIFE